MTTVEADRGRLMGMLWGFFPAQVLRTVAALRIADHLDVPRTPVELAERAGTCADPTARLLTAMVGLGLAVRDIDGRYALTPDGALLRAGTPGGLGGLAQLFCGDGPWRAWGELPASVRDGGPPALERLTGRPAFDWVAADPAMLAVFTEAMAEGTRQVATAVVDACDLTGVRSLVDVGGGNGTLLTAFLAAHPDLHGILFDLPSGIGDAADVLPAGTEIVTGDFFYPPRASSVGPPSPDGFMAVPSADAHVLKSVIHDWDDDRATAVLTAVRAAMPAHGTLFLVEPTLPDDPAELPASFVTLMSDLNMLVCTGGRERTEAEFTRLLEAAGLRHVDTIALASGYRVLRAVLT